MSWSRASAAAALLVVLLAVLVGVGRWERGRQIDREARGFREVEQLIGRLDNGTLAGFRELPAFDCLTYRRRGNPLALELCVDSSGRVVEAADRRAQHRRFWSLRFEPDASPVRVDRTVVDRLLNKMVA